MDASLTFLPCYEGLDVQGILTLPAAVRQHPVYESGALLKLLRAVAGGTRVTELKDFALLWLTMEVPHLTNVELVYEAVLLTHCCCHRTACVSLVQELSGIVLDTIKVVVPAFACFLELSNPVKLAKESIDQQTPSPHEGKDVRYVQRIPRLLLPLVLFHSSWWRHSRRLQGRHSLLRDAGLIVRLLLPEHILLHLPLPAPSAPQRCPCQAACRKGGRS